MRAAGLFLHLAQVVQRVSPVGLVDVPGAVVPDELRVDETLHLPRLLSCRPVSVGYLRQCGRVGGISSHGTSSTV